MQTQQEFWSDPKVWLSLLALIVSIIVACYNIFRHTEEDRRWNHLNGPNLVFTSIKMDPVMEISRSEYLSKNWGYSPFVLQKFQNPNTFIVKTDLALVTAETLKPIKKVNPALTVEEIQYYALQARITIGEESIVAKRLTCKLQLQNLGKTDAKNFGIDFFYKYSDQEDFISDPNNNHQKMTVKHGHNMYFVESFHFKLNEELPSAISVKVEMSYQNPDTRKFNKEGILFTYSSEDDGWIINHY